MRDRLLPMLLAGDVSVLFSFAFFVAAAADMPSLMMVAVYAATGGVDFVIQAYLLVRRNRRPAAMPA